MVNCVNTVLFNDSDKAIFITIFSKRRRQMLDEQIKKLTSEVKLLNERIRRLERLIESLIEDEIVTEEELADLEEVDRIIKNKEFEKLVRIK